jgi:hypothetical protein
MILEERVGKTVSDPKRIANRYARISQVDCLDEGTNMDLEERVEKIWGAAKRGAFRRPAVLLFSKRE